MGTFNYTQLLELACLCVGHYCRDTGRLSTWIISGVQTICNCGRDHPTIQGGMGNSTWQGCRPTALWDHAAPALVPPAKFPGRQRVSCIQKQHAWLTTIVACGATTAGTDEHPITRFSTPMAGDRLYSSEFQMLFYAQSKYVTVSGHVRIWNPSRLQMIHVRRACSCLLLVLSSGS